MLRYYKRYNGENSEQEISYEQALDTVLGTFEDDDATRDMLTVQNYIVCMVSTIRVDDPDNPLKPMPGLWNQLPEGVEYDSHFMRIKN